MKKDKDLMFQIEVEKESNVESNTAWMVALGLLTIGFAVMFVASLLKMPVV
jgi:hypothetical protein